MNSKQSVMISLWTAVLSVFEHAQTSSAFFLLVLPDRVSSFSFSYFCSYCVCPRVIQTLRLFVLTCPGWCVSHRARLPDYWDWAGEGGVPCFGWLPQRNGGWWEHSWWGVGCCCTSRVVIEEWRRCWRNSCRQGGRSGFPDLEQHVWAGTALRTDDSDRRRRASTGFWLDECGAFVRLGHYHQLVRERAQR